MSRSRRDKTGNPLQSSLFQQTLNLSLEVETELTTIEAPENDEDGRGTGDFDKPDAYSVSEVTLLLEALIDEDDTLGGLLVVRGELSNVKQSSRGHVYFTLRDEHAAINGILWASTANRLTFDLEDGLEVYLTGKLEIYRPSGTYSIVGKKIEPVGVGALQLAFQQTKERLEAEGLFMEEFKKPIPEFPERIGIVTSRTGAVIHDMLRVIKRKNPLVNVLIAPVKVQGDGAAEEIATAIEELNHAHYALDTIVVARGGGSFEDLFCFSEEAVVRAIFASRVPVVTGIGHEPDYSLADATADYSAATPTAAAEWSVPDACRLMELHAARAALLTESMVELLLEAEQGLDYHATRLLEYHEHHLEAASTALLRQQERLLAQGELYFKTREQDLARLASELDAFSPLSTLARGYAIATRADGTVVNTVGQANPGESVNIRLTDGTLACRVQEITQQQGANEP